MNDREPDDTIRELCKYWKHYEHPAPAPAETPAETPADTDAADATGVVLQDGDEFLVYMP